MNVETAKAIHDSVQSSIAALNALLVKVQPTLDNREFSELKRLIAEAMGQLVHTEEMCVYKHFPELRP